MNKRLSDKQYQCYILINQKYPGDEPFTSKMLEVHGNTLSSLANAGFVTRINDKSPYQYINNHIEILSMQTVSQSKKVSFEDTKIINSWKNNKSDNQWIGKFFELCCVEQINHTNIIPDPTKYVGTQGYPFTEQEKQILYKQAKYVADYIGPGHIAEWVGNQTIKGTGDILLDGISHIEIKHVAGGSSTYHSTSMYYLKDTFNIDFEDYLKKYKLRELVQQLNPDLNVSFTNNSIVDEKTAQLIQEQRPAIFQTIKAVDTAMRAELVTDVTKYLKTHSEQAQVFYTDMASKYKVSQHVTCSADRFIVYNYQLNTIEEFNLNEIRNSSIDYIKANKLGFWLGKLKFQLGWQNRIGCNPTIRVFLS